MEKKQSNNNVSIKNYNWLIIILILMFLPLPFHIVPSALKIFPKEHLTYRNTVIFSGDIDKIIEKYNDSSVFQQSAMKNNPFINTLFDEGLIAENK